MTNKGYLRAAAAVPRVTVADVAANTERVKEIMTRAHGEGVELLVFPELCLCGYTCGDLFRQPMLLNECRRALDALCQHLHSLVTDEKKGYNREMITIVGLPLSYKGKLYNVAAILDNDNVLAFVPKTYLPNHNEFYEQRWFSSGANIVETKVRFGGKDIYFANELLFQINEAIVGIEICEDLWMPNNPGSKAALEGANVIVNLSASNEVIGKHSYLRDLIRIQSAKGLCGYVYASAGIGESSTDLVYTGNAIIAENGVILAESPRFTDEELITIADIDVSFLTAEKFNSSFSQVAAGSFDIISLYDENKFDEFGYEVKPKGLSLIRKIDPMPFVPADGADRDERCEEIINIQTAGLMQRLRHTHCKTLVVGISGGLDSTLALLVAVNAFDKLGLDRKGIIGITMPGLGTSSRTLTNALTIMKMLGITTKEIPIAKAVEQHFKDIDQDPGVFDVTYENSQARERTQILMDYANKTGGMVLGTGDLSELALGWCTYNGDHMSMYAVNASIPKTLVKHLVKWFATRVFKDNTPLREALLDIIDTPISPELTPTDQTGKIAQKTEDLVGPYELHDFFLYHMLRRSATPDRIFYLACLAFDDKYSKKTIMHWLKTFYRRFFNQQFKRSCMPDGPKVGSVCLSPRGDWRMPSDASSALWLAQLDKIEETLADE